jgi:transcriptional regulator with XRE-family HTH domain
LTLKELRLAAGLQQADVAKKLNVTITAVSNWELGKNAILRKYHKKLAKLYGVTEDDIIAAVRLAKKLEVRN